MAIVKPIKVRIGNLAGLREVLEYIKNGDKTKDGALVFDKDLLKGIPFYTELFHEIAERSLTFLLLSFTL